jgi:hypothetical protein
VVNNSESVKLRERGCFVVHVQRLIDVTEVSIYVPTRGYVWHETASRLGPHGPNYLRCTTGVADARTLIVRSFLENPAKPEVLVMVDDDVIPPVNFMDIAGHVLTGRADVCAAVVHVQLDGAVFLPNVFQRDDTLPRGYKLSTDFLRYEGLQDVDAVGTGLIAIHRNVLTDRRMKDAFKADFTSGAGEDVLFCRRALKARFTVKADFDIWCDHRVDSSAVGLANAYMNVINSILEEQ